MPRSVFFVSRLSITSISTRIVSPSSTGATIRSSPPRYAMPVPWISPVCMMSPSDSENVSAPGAARRLKTDSRLTYSISMKSGSTKPQRLTKLTMSVSDTVRASDGERLLLAARERAGHLGHALLQTGKELERPVEVGLDVGVGAQIGAHGEILSDGETFEDPPALRHVRDPARDDLVRGHAGQRAAVEDDAAAARNQQPRDGLEGGGLAGAVVAEQRHDLAAAHLEGHTAQGVDLAVVHVQALQLQQGYGPARPEEARRPRYASITRGSAWTSRGGPSAIFSPWSSTVTRSETSITTRMLCSMRMMARPSSPTRRRSSAMSVPASACVMPAVGSSSNSRAGSEASARASSSRRCSPYARLRAISFPLPRSPTRSSSTPARCQRAPSASTKRRPRVSTSRRPSRMRECIPTRMFSAAVMLANSRMFWNVRHTPSAVISSGRSPTSGRPRKVTAPVSGRYRPVNTLNSVVLPAPLGPMIDAMPPSSANVTRCRAVRPPNVLVTSTASNIALIHVRGGPRHDPPLPPMLGAPREARGAPRSHVRSLLAQLTLASSRREDALRAKDHHQDEDQAEDHPLVLRGLQLGGQVREVVAEDRHAGVLQLVEPERQSLEHLEVEHGDDGGADDGARDAAHAAQDDHRQHADRLEKRERLRVDEDLLGREHHAHHSRERCAGGERQEFGSHQWHAHRLGGQLVFANGFPRSTDMRVLQPAIHEDDDDDDEQREEIEAHRVRNLERQRRTRDRRDAARAVGHVDRLVEVVGEDPDDLAEAERDDGQVVAAQSQNRQSEHHAGAGGDGDADEQERAEPPGRER